MQEDIYIVGAGTYGEVMLEFAEQLDYKVKGFYDEKFGEKHSVMGIKIIDKFSNLNEHEIKNKNFIVAIGNNQIRYSLMIKINRWGGRTPTLIHPSAIISPSAQIGKGVYIQANAYVWAYTRIDNFSIISPGVVIAHHTTIGKACLISTLSGVGASIKIADKVFLGMNSTIVTGTHKVGESSIIGAGAVVLNDIDKESVYVGVPAKKIRNQK